MEVARGRPRNPEAGMSRGDWPLRGRSLYDELDVAPEVAVVIVVGGDVVAVGQDPHLHGAVGAAREDVIGGPRLQLHDARAQVAEQRLARVLAGEVVEQSLVGQAPDLRRTSQHIVRVSSKGATGTNGGDVY